MVTHARIYAIVEQIPKGYVSTYGRIARRLNCGARQIGYALAATPYGQNTPWHRVINSQGKISQRKQGDRDSHQKQLLLAEGITFDRHDRVDLERFGWPVTEDP